MSGQLATRTQTVIVRAGSVDVFETERMFAERMRAGDLDELCAMHRDSDVMANLGGVRSAGDTRRFLEACRAHWERHGFGLWMLRARSDGRFLGRGGLRRFVVGGAEEIELAYAFMPQAWGRGLASELAAAALEIGFERLGAAEVVAFALTTNERSHRVMRKAGLTFERHIMHAGLPHVLYRITAQAYARRHHAPAGAGQA